jgi:hypothetical protein
MTRHRLAIWGANAGGILLFLCILFGHSFSLDIIGVKSTLREMALALWAFLLPAWFTVEAMWFAPPTTDHKAIAEFHADQNRARATWLIVGGVITILIGTNVHPRL